MSEPANTDDLPVCMVDRQHRLGATDVSAVIGANKWKTPYELWLEKTGRIEPWKGNDATKYGQRFEPVVLDFAEEQLGELERDVLVYAPAIDGVPIAATLDARIVATGDPVEAKTTGIVSGRVSDEWGDEGTDMVPDMYLVQAQIQMLCTGSELCHLFALIPGRGIVRYHVARSTPFLEATVVRCADWWEKHIVNDVPPEQTEVPSMDVLARIRREPEKVIAFDDDSMELVRHWEALKEQKAALDKLERTAKEAVLASLGDAEGATLTDGRTLTFMETSRKGYTVGPTTYRTLRIAKAK